MTSDITAEEHATNEPFVAVTKTFQMSQLTLRQALTVRVLIQNFRGLLSILGAAATAASVPEHLFLPTVPQAVIFMRRRVRHGVY